MRGIATGYELQIDLVRAISLHKHKIDHIAHLGPSAAAGIGTLLDLPPDVIYQAIGQALHTTTTTRQSRKGEISSWKAYAPAFAGKVAIEAVDRAMRGQTSPSPIYEGEDGVIAWLLDGPDAHYEVPLPEPGEPKRAILASYTKEYSAEYQAQAWIDLARKLFREHPDVADPERVESIVIHTSHHTHNVIGSGAADPQKYDPAASRETLDHSLPYIFAVALQDGTWHHDASYTRERATRPDTVALWRKVTTVEDEEWTARYHAAGAGQSYGGRVVITLTDGSQVVDEISVADAHPGGARPFGRDQYVEKFRSLAVPVVGEEEAERFMALALRLPELDPKEVRELTFAVLPGMLPPAGPTRDLLKGMAMLYATTTPAEKRAALRQRLSEGELLQFPGAFNPLSAKLIERRGFDGVYVSGAVLSADLGLPDIGSDNADRGRHTHPADRTGDRIAGARRRGHRFR